MKRKRDDGQEQDEISKLERWDEWCKELLPEGHPFPSQLYHTAMLRNNELTEGLVLAVHLEDAGAYRLCVTEKKVPPHVNEIDVSWLKGRHVGRGLNMLFEKAHGSEILRKDCIMVVNMTETSDGEWELNREAKEQLQVTCKAYPEQLKWRQRKLEKLAKQSSSLRDILANPAKIPAAEYDKKRFEYKRSEIVDLKGLDEFKGMFAKKKVKCGEWVGEYRGKVCTSYKLLHEKKNGKVGQYLFSVQIMDDNDFTHMARTDDTVCFLMDAEDASESSWLRYINAADFYLGPAKRNDAVPGVMNCKFIQIDHRIFLRAIRDIPPGKELLTWYGESSEDIINEHEIPIEQEPEPRYSFRQKSRFRLHFT
eukprot:TRINITY_DN2815_c0_g7_i1.p1 TRINITY_DN2815_c0_g7~~TRINITY_DN2815_c0_g7_i1.p1  ORF type:complete len:366 (+),score=47.44 TRINITY_DN2815_c0_g7_i1:75-1172(+)